MKHKAVAVMFALLVSGLVLAWTAGADEMVPGTVEETEDFSFLVPEGWQCTVFASGTVQIHNRMGSYMVELKKEGYNMTDEDLDMVNQLFVKQYEGTPLEEVEMLGLKFYQTTFEFGGRQQSLYTALKEGIKISIGMMGEEHATEPTIQAVLQSITLK